MKRERDIKDYNFIGSDLSMLPRAAARDTFIMPHGLAGETVCIDRYKAIVDERAPEHVYAVASDIYKIVQHEEGLRLLER